MKRTLLILVIMIASMLPSKVSTASELIEEVQNLIDSLEGHYDAASGLEKDLLAFQLGYMYRSPEYKTASNLIEAEALFYLARFQVGDLMAAKSWLDNFETNIEKQNDITAKHLYYSFQILREDFSFAEELQSRKGEQHLDEADYITLGILAKRRFDYETAHSSFAAAINADQSPILNSVARIRTAEVLYREQKFQECYNTLLYTLRNGSFSDDLLRSFSNILLRLGRISEATELMNLTLEINPLNGWAHYSLGNGFGKWNYTQLAEKYPEQFPDSLPEIRPDELVAEHPEWVRLWVMLAEDAWVERDLDRAKSLCFEALDRCPDYGRAHAMLAKILESYRLRQSIYYQSDNADFTMIDFPTVPEIDKYVLNWETLCERHRKRVAMSIEPWKSFIPVLVAAGHTYYIKPVHEKLSECPYMEEMADQRINLDSRLWDDVRGAGGYNTVTGIEDVEQTIFKSYNTVLHELTHQVHGILTEPEKERIETTFRKAKAREEGGEKLFLSRYQASNPWEYFAEGVNAYYSPRRDENDPREIVRERLFDMNSALVELVEHFTAINDISPYLVVGRVNSAEQLLEKAKPEEAWELLNEIPETDQEAQPVLYARSWISSILDRDGDAIRYARRAVELYPDNATSYKNLSTALHHSSPDIEPAMDILQKGIDNEECKSVHQIAEEIGWLQWKSGRYREAVSWFEKALTYQNDLPVALWGLGVCWGDLSIEAGIDTAHYRKSRKYFEKVLPVRSGIVSLRLAYARILLQHGDIDEAVHHIDEGENIRADDPLVWCYRAWVAAVREDSVAARTLLEKAAGEPAAPDLAEVLIACLSGDEERAELLRRTERSIPRLVFDPRIHEYVTRGEYPAWQRRLLMEGVKKR